jgi:hypothetical protein
MKKLMLSLPQRAKREGRIGVSVISNMGFFFLYDGGGGDASEKISYDTSLPSKIEGGNVRGFSYYNARDYKNLDDSQKKELLTQGLKKSLEVQKLLHVFLLMHKKKESEDYRRASTSFFPIKCNSK